MKGTHGFGSIRTTAATTAIAATALTLAGCPGGGESESSAFFKEVGTDVAISGSVGDGPIANASVVIRTRKGSELANLSSDADGTYVVEMNVPDNRFPLRVEATGGTDIVTDMPPDFVLRSAVLSPSSTITANVNPFSTFAYEIAADMNGGHTSDNLVAAEDIVTTSMNSGLSSLMVGGPMRTAIDGSNVAEIIKSSETLAEIVRRTRDALNGAGQSVNGDDVIRALASDLIDGVIEGNGGPRANARIAAVATVASAQVLLEAMRNELRVNGVDATEGMRRAVDQVVPEGVQPGIDELAVTPEMIEQAKVALAAAYAASDDTAIFDLKQTLDGVQPGMDAALVRTVIPADQGAVLDPPLAMTASGAAGAVNAVNAVARNGDSTAVENRGPVISGQPATSVRAGVAYDFRPVASDLDGDPLTFTVEALPDWASFDTATGRLWGTPQAGDAGTYAGITITVSDGSLSSDVGPFTITVETDNRGPSISGTPRGTVGVGERYAFTPTASDPDNTALRFSIVRKPGWADFDVVNGRLSGTPESAHVGVYSDIEISVTDGVSTATLAPFSIEVIAAGAATGSVTLDWTPPTQNEDGSPLMDLAAYRVYWSRDGGLFDNSVTINNPSVTRFVVDNLAPGAYEFAATAINDADVESRFSNTVTKVVQ